MTKDRLEQWIKLKEDFSALVDRMHEMEGAARLAKDDFDCETNFHTAMYLAYSLLRKPVHEEQMKHIRGERS